MSSTIMRISKDYENKLKIEKTRMEKILGFSIDMTQFTRIKSAISGDMIIVEKPKRRRIKIVIKRNGGYF